MSQVCFPYPASAAVFSSVNMADLAGTYAILRVTPAQEGVGEQAEMTSLATRPVNPSWVSHILISCADRRLSSLIPRRSWPMAHPCLLFVPQSYVFYGRCTRSWRHRYLTACCAYGMTDMTRCYSHVV